MLCCVDTTLGTTVLYPAGPVPLQGDNDRVVPVGIAMLLPGELSGRERDIVGPSERHKIRIDSVQYITVIKLLSFRREHP